MGAGADKLRGQVAWVSGAASGIGEAIAKRFAAEQALVAIVDIDREQGERVASEIAAAGGRATFIRADVGCEQEVQASIDACAATLGGLHIVVNGAGVVDVGMLHEMTSAAWDRLMDVNLRSMFLSFKYAWPHLGKSSRSYILNIGSISSLTGQEQTPAYCASKGAVLQLTRNIALDYARFGLRCNCLCPGITDTPLLRRHLSTAADPDQVLRERLSRVPMGIPLEAAHVASAAVFLCCDDSFGITGTSLVIDGGYLSAAECHSPARTAFMD